MRNPPKNQERVSFVELLGAVEGSGKGLWDPLAIHRAVFWGSLKTMPLVTGSRDGQIRLGCERGVRENQF
jgi:hypothetical protein